MVSSVRAGPNHLTSPPLFILFSASRFPFRPVGKTVNINTLKLFLTPKVGITLGPNDAQNLTLSVLDDATMSSNKHTQAENRLRSCWLASTTLILSFSKGMELMQLSAHSR